ncbi:MAG: hypothetical protein QNJ72_39370 [Pleurocapsa sp. MO_226.B13]|nr:hypothetical protein [Pleurocapsa sp. MO_226.B13]
MDLRKIDREIKAKEKQIEIAEQELLELEQEYQDSLIEAEICGSQHPSYTMSNSIKLQHWRIEKLYNQKSQLEDKFNDLIND